MGKDDFLPAEKVILEPEPRPEPGGGDARVVTIVRQDTDAMEMAAELRRPACW